MPKTAATKSATKSGEYTVLLPASVYERIQKDAKALGVSENEVMNRCVREYLTRDKTTTTASTTEQGWARVRELLGNLKPGELTADSKQYTLTGGALEALQLAAKLKDQPFKTFAREYLNGLIRRDIQDGAGDSAQGLRDWLATVKELPANGKLTLQVTLSLDVRNWNFVAHAMHTRKLSLDELISEVLSTGADTADMDEPVKA